MSFRTLVPTPDNLRANNRCMGIVLFLVVLFAVPSKHVYAQNNEPAEWKFLKEVENVRFSYATAECESQQFLLLKIENLNTSQVFGNWYLNVNADGVVNRYAGILTEIASMTIKSGICSMPEPHLVIPLTKAASELTVTLDVEITKP